VKLRLPRSRWECSDDSDEADHPTHTGRDPAQDLEPPASSRTDDPPGDTVSLTAPDAANGEVTALSTSEDIGRINYRRLDPLVGPVYVEGAQTGDALKIDVLELIPLGWGWTALLPEFGILWREIKDPWLKIWTLDKDYVEMPNGSRFDLQPDDRVHRCGTCEGWRLRLNHPTNAAGNIDVRYLNVGSSLIVPVFNDGALLSAADGHALQGEGEICGTAIECPMEMTLRVDLIKNAGIEWPELIVKDTFPATEGYRIFTGIGPDLMEAARDSVRHAISSISEGTEGR